MKYNAFISYRHTELDMFVAKKIHKSLETLRVPGKIRKLTGKKRIERVFRDQEELPIGSDLGNNIEAALAASEYLIVICSPRAKESDWVRREIDTFIQMHGRQKVLAVLVEGEPQDSFPPAILTDEYGNPVEPLAADVRGSDRREIMKKMKIECLRLAAPLLGCSFDDLRQRHRERKMRKYIAIASGISVLGICFGIYNAMVANQISQKNVEITRKSNEIQTMNEEILLKNDEISEKNTQMLINQSRYLADLSLQVYQTGDRRTAGLLALEGLPVNGDRPLVPDSLYALSTAMDVYSIGSTVRKDQVLNHDFTVSDMKFSDDGSYVVSRDRGNCVYLWDLNSGDLLWQLKPELVNGDANEVKDIGFCEDSFISACKYGFKRIAYDGTELVNVTYSSKSASFSYISDDGSLLVCSYLDYVKIFDTKTGEELKHFDKDPNFGFSGYIALSKDHKYMAVSHSTLASQESPSVSLINLENGQTTLLETALSSILDMVFTEDGNLAVATYGFFGIDGTDDTDFYIEVYDVEQLSLKWRRSYEYSSSILSTGYTNICSKIYTDVENTEHRELSICEGRNVYTMDLETGSDISYINTSSDIEKIIVHPTTCYGYIAERDGKFNTCNFTNGDTYPNITVSTGADLVDAGLKNGVIITSRSYSSDIDVLRRIKSPSIETFSEEESYIETILSSPDESKLALLSSPALTSKIMHGKIYNTETGKLLHSFEIEDSIKGDGIFLDEKRVLYMNYHGEIYEYNLETEKLSCYKIMKDRSSVNLSIDCFSNKGLAYSGFDYCIFSLENMQEIETFSADIYLFDAVYVEGSGYITGYDSNYLPYRIDLETKECTLIAEEIYANGVDVSADGQKAAFACIDGVIRVYDLKSLTQLNEIADYTSTSSYLKLSDDGKCLYYQPEDLQIKIYDLENDSYKFVSTNSYYRLDSVTYVPGDHILIVKNPYYMYLIDCDSYGMLGQAEYGNVFLPKHGFFLSENGSTVYRLPYYSPSELLEEAKRQYAGYSLSDEQRLAFFLD